MKHAFWGRLWLPALILTAGIMGAPQAHAQTTGVADGAPPPPPPGVLALSLDEALSLAVEANPSISAAELSRLMAQIQENRAKLNRFSVVVDVNGGLNAGLVKPWKADGYTTQSANWGTGVTASVPIFSGGRVEGLIRQAELDAEIADVDRATAVRAIERAVILNYWTILSFELQLEASEEALEINKEALAVSEARARYGLAAPIDVNRSRVNVLDLQDSILSLQSQMFQTKQDLLELMNQQGSQLVLTDEARADFRDWPTAADDLIAEARNTRPDLRRFESEAKRADASVAIARSGALPTVSVVGVAQAAGAGAGGSERVEVITDEVSGQSIEYTFDPEFDGEDLGPDLNASLGLNLSWTPFTLFQTRDAVSVAKLGREQVDARYESQMRSVENDVKSAHNSLMVLKSRTPYIDQRLDLARDNLQIIQALYAQGNARILDLLQAQSAYQQATVQRASHQVNLIVAEYELRWAIGERFAPESRGESSNE